MSRASGRRLLLCVGLLSCASAIVATGASVAQPTKRHATVTIRMQANFVGKNGYEALIANFERVNPNIEIEVDYAGSNPDLFRLETTQLAAGNGPDLFVTYPGCGTPISVCTLAKSGYMAPMLKKPWAKRSVPLVTSMDKVGRELYAFTPIVSLYGVFTNDDLFKRLGLKIPETYPQLLTLCRKAKAAGTVAMIVPGNSPTDITSFLSGLAVPLVYGKDKSFLARQKAGTATFAGSAGWRQALREFGDMNAAGCFQPGAAGTSGAAAPVQFAQGQGLMLPAITNNKGLVDAAKPTFAFSHHLLPAGSTPGQVRTFVHLSLSLAVNAHASPEKQEAAQTAIDFFARPAQNALFARIQGGMTQFEFRTRDLPAFMSTESSAVTSRAYAIEPAQTWPNANVSLAMQNNQTGLITGQRTADDVLKAMDAAWKPGTG